jgi:hypothetical protein
MNSSHFDFGAFLFTLIFLLVLMYSVWIFFNCVDDFEDEPTEVVANPTPGEESKLPSESEPKIC